MKTQLYYLTISLLLLFSCTKEGASDAKHVGDGGKNGSLARFAIVGNYLYIVDDMSLHVVDISNPAAPERKDKTYIGWRIETIFPYDGKLFIGSSDALYIYSLGDPQKPTPEGRAQHFRACDPVVAAGNTAYVTLRSSTLSACGGDINALMVYDVTNIKTPVLKKNIPLAGPYGLGVQDSALYVCDGPKGLKVFNIKSPLDPVSLQTINDGRTYLDVIPYGSVLIAYVTGGVRFFDISTPQKPALFSELRN